MELELVNPLVLAELDDEELVFRAIGQPVVVLLTAPIASGGGGIVTPDLFQRQKAAKHMERNDTDGQKVIKTSFELHSFIPRESPT